MEREIRRYSEVFKRQVIEEYGLGTKFRTKQQAVVSIKQSVHLYNTRRPHLALKYKTPAEVHLQAA